MTAKRSKIPHAIDSGVSEDGSIRDDDSSSSSGSGSSVESSTSESPPPEGSMDGDQIRQNARELLQSSPDRGRAVEKNGSVATAKSATTSNATASDRQSDYASYHDAPTARMSSTSQFSNYSNNTTTAAIPPWASGGHSNETDEGLSVTDVATLALSCVAKCLTEGYRAASNYYGDYDHPTQHPSVSGTNYQQVGGDSNEAYGNVASPNNYQTANDGYKHQGYYSDSYQSEVSNKPSGNREVMERDVPQDTNGVRDGQGKQQATPQIATPEEEWATVHVPSTYQGGRVWGGN